MPFVFNGIGCAKPPEGAAMTKGNTIHDLPTFMHEGLRENGWREGNLWSGREILDAWLKWEGIFGYTDTIIEAVNVTEKIK